MAFTLIAILLLLSTAFYPAKRWSSKASFINFKQVQFMLKKAHISRLSTLLSMKIMYPTIIKKIPANLHPQGFSINMASVSAIRHLLEFWGKPQTRIPFLSGRDILYVYLLLLNLDSLIKCYRINPIG